MRQPWGSHWEIFIMINLISTEEKKKTNRDFYFRLAMVVCIMLGLSILAAAIALLPSYFLVSVKENAANQKLDLLLKEPVPAIDQKTTQTIADLNSRLISIENAEQNKFPVSQKVINEIILKKMPDIKITQFSYSNSADKGKFITVRGIAPNRERLLLFRVALEDDSAFSKVDLPISNFVKGSNIEFFLNLIPS